MFGPLSLDMYLPGLPLLGRDLDAPTWAAQATLSGFVVGLAVGQLLGGPISDRFGRRAPLLGGLAAYTALSALCALSPSIWMLLSLRIAQGLAGAIGVVIARAMVRDMASGVQAARIYGLLMLVSGAAPIVAPIVGGQVLRLGDWRMIFWTLTAIGLVLLGASLARLPETLPVALRRTGGWRATRRAMARVIRDRRFVRHTAVASLSFSMLLTYVAGSPFLLQSAHGLSPQSFSLTFCLNACGIVAARQLAIHLLGRFDTTSVLRFSLFGMIAGSAVLVTSIAFSLGLVPVLAGLFIAIASFGGVTPTVTALAMEDHPDTAGSAAGLLGFSQFALAAALAPLVGALGTHAGAPMGLVMLSSAVGALAVLPGALRQTPPAGAA